MNRKLSFKASAENFAKIPGSPIAYWVGEKMIKAFENKTIGDNFDSSVGLQTGDNNKFIRFWFEVSFDDILFGAKTFRDTFQTRKYFPYNKGGSFRKWFGNDDSVVDWRNDGKNIKDNANRTGHHWQQYTDELKFKELITWSRIASDRISFRYKPFGYMSDMSGFSLFANGKMSLLYLLGFTNTHVVQSLLNFLSPTINYMLGPVNSLPIVDNIRMFSDVETIVAELITLSRSDWDEYETSWDFKVNPLVREGWQKNAGGMSLEIAWAAVFARRMEWAARMKELEEENNRLFIEAYGLEDELKPDVAWKDVSITGNPFYRYKVDSGQCLVASEGEVDDGDDANQKLATNHYPLTTNLAQRARMDAVRELISYGIGCLMGRYSLEQEGLILASQGETYQDYFSRVHGVDKLRPDDDGILPMVAGETAFTDNAPYRVVDFIKAAFGEEHLTENLNFIEATLGTTLEAYLAKEFWNDHKRMYKNRPIYWLFRSKKGAFQVLVYMHRMDAYTATKVRNGYLLPHIEFLRGRIAAESARGAELTAKERTKLKKMQQAMEECLEYDGRLHVVADRMQGIDLDDGVAVNYAKFGDVLAKLK